MKLSDTFLLFCENTEIMILDSQPVQYGVKYKVSRRGEEAFMTLYDNGSSLPQGPWNSSLLKLLQVWSCTNPAQRQMTEEEARMFLGGGMPAFYLSWREWKEEAGSLKKYIKDKNATEFNSLKNFDVSIFTSSDTYSTLVNEIKTAQEAVKAARTKLDSYIAEVLALNDEEKNAVVLEVIGSTDAKEIMNKLLALKTVEEIETKYNELKTRIDAIDKARADAKAAELEAANKPFNFGDAKYTTHTSPNGDRFTPLTTMTLSDMSTKNTVIDLMEVDDMQHCNFESALSTSITNLNKFVTAITKSLSSSYNQSALSKAASKVLSLYTKAIQASKPHATITRHSEADTWTERFEFEGEAYEYQAASYYYNHNAVNTQYSSGCSASNNQLGLRVCYEHHDVEYKILVNSKCVIDLFQKFYKEALSA